MISADREVVALFGGPADGLFTEVTRGRRTHDIAAHHDEPLRPFATLVSTVENRHAVRIARYRRTDQFDTRDRAIFAFVPSSK